MSTEKCENLFSVTECAIYTYEHMKNITNRHSSEGSMHVNKATTLPAPHSATLRDCLVDIQVYVLTYVHVHTVHVCIPIICYMAKVSTYCLSNNHTVNYNVMYVVVHTSHRF